MIQPTIEDGLMRYSRRTMIPITQATAPIYLLQAPDFCPHCATHTDVYCIAVSGVDGYQEFMRAKVLSYVPPELDALLNLFAARYSMAYDVEVGDFVYTNHCAHCRRPIPSKPLHKFPLGAFTPRGQEFAEKMTIRTLAYEGSYQFCAKYTTSHLDGLILDFALPVPNQYREESVVV